VPSVRVSIVDENYQPIRTVFSDSSGRFQISRLRAGSYYLRVESTGLPCEEYSRQIDLYSMTRRASSTEEPTLEDVILRRKKLRNPATGAPPGVVFMHLFNSTQAGFEQKGYAGLLKSSRWPNFSFFVRR
jgi:hypothetical protein